MASVACKNECKHLLRKIITNGRRFMSAKPAASAAVLENDLTIFDIDNKTGIATMSLNNPPINAMNIELLRSMKMNLEQAEKDKVRGLILTSSLENIFSTGFDIAELYSSNREHLTELISLGQDVSEAIHTFPFPTAALINGHALGGGCGTAVSCEYRVMMPKYRIGMVEVAVGIVPNNWVRNIMLEVLDRRTAELALTQGKQFRTDEALKVNFVDEIINDKSEGLIKCHQFIDSFKNINPAARTLTKRQFRLKLFNDKPAELKELVDELMEPRVRETIGAYLNSLKMKR